MVSVDRELHRYDCDVYGRPRFLSRYEVMLHGLARPVALGVILGYCLTISVVAAHDYGLLNFQAKIQRAHATARRTAP